MVSVEVFLLGTVLFEHSLICMDEVDFRRRFVLLEHHPEVSSIS